MPTLYDYIASLKVDGSPVVWSNRPLTKSEIDSAAGKPYIRVDEVGEGIDTEIYGHVNVMSATVDVFLYQAPASSSVMPNRSNIMKLYFELFDSVKSVDSWIYGQPLIHMQSDFSMPPKYDEDTGGLFGMVRFRLLFPRG